MLSRKAKYALRALEYLALHKGPEPAHIADMAKDEGLPQKFLERILLDLRKQGILYSRKGKGGGYQLNRPAKEIRLGDVIRLMDGPLAPVSCVSQTAYAKCADCKDERTCCVRFVMKDVRDAIAGVLDGMTLADMVRKTQAGSRTSKPK
jgi:Rrf2 family protein